MIMVEINIPAIDTEYDFSLDEDVQIKLLIEEIAEMICRKEQNKLIGNEERFSLCSVDKTCILSKNKTLRDYGINNGEKLLLV